jgi:hypothetical protein
MVTAAHVRFGSKADIEAHPADFCFTPKADIAERDHDARFVRLEKRTHALQQTCYCIGPGRS